MDKGSKQTPLHVSVRRKLVEHIAARGTPGGRLPPERELCQTLGVSYGTVRKALGQLVDEGLVIRNPPKGSFISYVQAPPKLGVVCGDGGFSPQLSPALLSGEMDVLSEAGCNVRLVNLRQDTEAELAKLDLDGLLWNSPPLSMLPLIERHMEKLPLVVAMLAAGPGSDHVRLPNNLVALDYAAVGRLRAGHFLSKGITRVACLGDGEDSATLHAFIQTLAAAGHEFNWKWWIKSAADVPERLPELIAKEGIRGVVSNGGRQLLETLFRTLQALAFPERLEVLPDLVHGVPELLRRYPWVEVEAVNEIPCRELGAAAAAALLAQLRTGVPTPTRLITTRLKRFTP